jgi:hypothetical protein
MKEGVIDNILNGSRRLREKEGKKKGLKEGRQAGKY